jgi:hypothetical protein
VKSTQRPARIRRLVIATAVLTPLFAGAGVASATITQAANPAATPFQVATLREKGSINPSDLPDIGKYASIALNSVGNPVIAYYDADRNDPSHPTGPLGNGDLKVMVCGNATCSAGNTVTVVDRGRIYTDDAGKGASLALDNRGFPVISYFDRGSGLMLARCSDATCTRPRIQVVDAKPYTEFGNTSLMLDGNGLPVISFSAQGALSLIRCRNANCDPNASSGLSSGPAVSLRFVDNGVDNALALDMKGNPVISYYDAVRDDLRVAHCASIDCSDRTISIQIVDQAGDVGQFNALRMMDITDIRTGTVTSQRPFVSYYDATNGDLKVAYCGDPNCLQNNLIQTLDSTGDVGRYTSMPKSGRGSLAISFYDATKHNLKLAICDPGLPYAKTPTLPCQETQGNVVMTVDASGELAPPSTSDVGQFNSLVLDAKGNPVVTYYDATARTLKLAWK